MAALLSLCVAMNVSGRMYQPASPEHPIAAIERYELPQPNTDQKLQVRITYPTDAPPSGGAGPAPGSEAGHADENFRGRGYPVIIWSHGMGGSKDGYQPLATYWASHGYVVIQPTHDDSIGKQSGEMKQRLLKSRNLNLLTGSWDERPKQISLIIDSLEKIEKENPALAGRLDRQHIGVGGHSFGAHTTMMVSGFTLHTPGGRQSVQLADKRPIVFVAISPQGPGQAVDESSYTPMTRPMMMITGSLDSSPMSEKQDANWRLKAWEYVPLGDKYLLWVNDAHHGFGGIAGKVRYRNAGPNNEHQVAIVKTTALAMWDAWLKNDPAAKQWLHDAGDLRDGEQQAKVSRK